MSLRLTAAFLVVFAVITGFLHAREPDPPATYMGREIAQTMHFTGAEWLTRESRQREEDCTTMLKELHVTKSQTICDLGCGNGFYTLKLAEMVGPQGKVLAVDIQAEMLELLKGRAAEAGLANIETILATETDPMLPAASVDLVLMVDVYHELSQPAEVLAAVKRSLKKGGRVALVEFRKEDPNVPIKELHKMSKEQIRKEWTANGFRIVREFDGLPWQHLIFLEPVDAQTRPTTQRSDASRSSANTFARDSR